MELFEELYSCLVEQEEVVGKLIECGNKQAEALRLNDLGEINRAVRDQVYWTERLGAVGKKQLEIREGIEYSLKLPPGTYLSNIIAAAPDEMKNKLIEIVNILSDRMQELKDVTEANRILTSQGLRLYTRLLKVINPEKNKTYGKTGEIADFDGSVLNREV